MIKMLLRFLAVFAALLAAGPCAGMDFPPYPLVLPGSAFGSMHATAVATNQPGVTFMLRTIDGRTQFQCGERIQVQYVISSLVKNEYHCDDGVNFRDSVFSNDTFVCDASSGVVDPDPDVVNQLPIGDWMQSMDYLNSPKINTMDLNEWIAFDKPGTYRLYAITHRVYEIDERMEPRHPNEGPGNGPPTTSTILTLTITPTDKNWEHGVITQALAPYQGPWDEVMEQRGALLRYLRTKNAAVALVHELESSHTYQYAQDKDFYEDKCSTYLMESPYRVEMIPLMEHDIADPDIPITKNFLDTYSNLLYHKAYSTQPASTQTNYADDCRKRALSLLRQALPAKQGAAKSISSQTAKTFDKTGIDFP